MRYDLIPVYSMKCRLYPNKAQKIAIDDALAGLKVFHNCLVYDMFNNGINVTEKKRKTKDGISETETVHFPDLKTAIAAPYKNSLAKEHPIILKCPSSALLTNVGIMADLKREFGKLPIEMQKPNYYNDRRSRLSYTYQCALSVISFEKTDGINPNAFRIGLTGIGKVKVRGWNRKIRFGDESTDFLTWCANNKKAVVTVTVSRDNAGDYYIVFKLKGCMKPFPEKTDKQIGIDVGIKDIAICSDGLKFENKKFKKKEKRHQKLLNRKISRRWGASNEKYREEYKKFKAEQKQYFADPEAYGGAPPVPPTPSKLYLDAKRRHAKLNRKIAAKRDNWNHIISRRIVESYAFIGVESLNVKGMFRNKHLSGALSDAAISSILSYIDYKAKWHGRTVQEIGKWTPSSKRCSECGYIYQNTPENGLRPWGLGIRSWICPECKTHHDRDVNAAKNILYYALNENIHNQ